MSPEEEMVINRNIMKLQEHLYKALKQRDQYKAGQDSLIDDIAVLRANNKRLERENEQLKQQIEHLKENYESNRKHNKNLIERNKELERKSAAYDKMMTGEMGELYKKAEAFDEVIKASQTAKTFKQLGFMTSVITGKYWEDE